MNLQPETAKEEDIDEIMALEQETWIHTYPNQEEGITVEDIRARFNPEFYAKRKKEILSEFKNSHFRYRVIKKAGKIIGYSRGLLEKDYNDLVEIYVLPQYQTQGVGKLMMKDLFNWFGDKKPVRLEVARYNTKTIDFYKRLGFVHQPQLTQSPDEDWNILPSGKRIPVIFMQKA